MIARRLWPRHIGRHHPEEMLAQEKNKGGRAAHHARPDQTAMGSIAFLPMVTRARFATDLEGVVVWPSVDALQTPRRALLDNVDERAACRCRPLGSQQAFA